jgi:hypothetical protein
MSEHPDHHQYGAVLFYGETLEFFLSGLRFYEGLLQKDLDEINKDPDLKLFLNPTDTGRFPVHDELARVKRVHEWLTGELKGNDRFGANVSVSHGTVRFIKSVCQLYLQYLESKRNALAARPNISREALSAVDQKLSALREKTVIGVFKEATARPLLVEQMVSETPPRPVVVDSPAVIAATQVPRPVLIDTIEILDGELRSRCMDLFGQFSESGQHDRLDTVISEATRILEDRLRRHSGGAPNVVGVELATFALAGATPRIVLSTISAEQEAAHLLFRGVFGFVRNRVHHHLVADLSPARALQIVGTVDYLLSLLESVTVQPLTA